MNIFQIGGIQYFIKVKRIVFNSIKAVRFICDCAAEGFIYNPIFIFLTVKNTMPRAMIIPKAININFRDTDSENWAGAYNLYN